MRPMTSAVISAMPARIRVRVFSINKQTPRPIKTMTTPMRKRISPTRLANPSGVCHPTRVGADDRADAFFDPDQIGEDVERQGGEEHDEENEYA